jgi:hypothetical protein
MLEEDPENEEITAPNRLFDLEWAGPVSPFGASASWGPVAA